MARLDLNAKRAERSEAENEPHEVVLGFDAAGQEQVFRLRPRMPLEFPALLAKGKADEAMELILVDPSDWRRMRKAIPEDDDLYDIARLYDLDLGEPSASTSSSNNGGPSSRLTSNTSTDSTSAKPAGAKKRSGSDDSTS